MNHGLYIQWNNARREKYTTKWMNFTDTVMGEGEHKSTYICCITPFI